MKTPAERLKIARESAGYSNATDAARAMGVPIPTYIAHENPDGLRGLSRSGERYARFFRISLEWLLTGKGDMRGAMASIPVMGYVGAGSTIFPITDITGDPAYNYVDLPDAEHIAALVVRGESQWPRFIDGEIILYDARPMLARELVNNYAVIDILDGRRVIKMLRQGRNSKWILESHNAKPEETDDILAVYRVKGTLYK